MDRQQGLPAVAGKKLQEYPKVVFEQFYDEADIHKNLLPSGLRIFLAQRNYSSLGISPWICLRSENLFEHPKNLPQLADCEFLEAPLTFLHVELLLFAYIKVYYNFRQKRLMFGATR